MMAELAGGLRHSSAGEAARVSRPSACRMVHRETSRLGALLAYANGMRTLLALLRRFLVRRVGRVWSSGGEQLSAVEYEAISLMAYEGRAAYRRAREQADYCREMGSLRGAIFWNRVAAEVARPTGPLRTKARQ
jgi:hypothetical protein